MSERSGICEERKKERNEGELMEGVRENELLPTSSCLRNSRLMALHYDRVTLNMRSIRAIWITVWRNKNNMERFESTYLEYNTPARAMAGCTYIRDTRWIEFNRSADCRGNYPFSVLYGYVCVCICDFAYSACEVSICHEQRMKMRLLFGK